MRVWIVMVGVCIDHEYQASTTSSSASSTSPPRSSMRHRKRQSESQGSMEGFGALPEGLVAQDFDEPCLRQALVPVIQRGLDSAFDGDTPTEDPLKVYLRCLVTMKGTERGVDSMVGLMRRIMELAREEEVERRGEGEDMVYGRSVEEEEEQEKGLWKRMMKVRRGNLSCPCGPLQW